MPSSRFTALLVGVAVALLAVSLGAVLLYRWLRGTTLTVRNGTGTELTDVRLTVAASVRVIPSLSNGASVTLRVISRRDLPWHLEYGCSGHRRRVPETGDMETGGFTRISVLVKPDLLVNITLDE